MIAAGRVEALKLARSLVGAIASVALIGGHPRAGGRDRRRGA